MYKYFFKPHTADIRLYIQASSRKEILRGALSGMIDFFDVSVSRVNKIKSRKFKIVAGDDVSLLIDFLNEILTRISIDRVLYKARVITLKTDSSVEVIISGLPVIRFKHEIKAATFHESFFRITPEGLWEAQVIFDI
jgi:SHS2 domain-containing protein